MSNPNYGDIAKEARKTVLRLIYSAQTSHIGSNFSCIDLMAVLFSKFDWDKDKFVLSKGWAAASLYYFLWKYGRITEEELNSYCQPGSKFIGLSEPIHPDIPIAGGSMGLGLPGAVGLALAKKLKGEEGKVYVLMSDGEMQCGTTWESFLISRHHNLTNLVVIVDNNRFQAMGLVDGILSINYERVATRIDEIHYIDGHNFEKIEKAIECKDDLAAPKLIVANTIKGKGVSFMENNNEWHYRAPEKVEYEEALKELTI